MTARPWVLRGISRPGEKGLEHWLLPLPHPLCGGQRPAHWQSKGGSLHFSVIAGPAARSQTGRRVPHPRLCPTGDPAVPLLRMEQW